MIYTVTFNPAIDYVMHPDSFGNAVINRSLYEEIYYGGKGINVSAVLTRLGMKNKALGFAAGFSGRQLCSMLDEDNIDNDFIFLDKGYTRINVKLKSECETDINASGPEIEEKYINKLLEKLNIVDNKDYVVLAGSVPTSLPVDVYEKILKSFYGRNVKFVIDAAGDLLLKTLKYKPFLIKPNHFELGEFFNVSINTKADIIKYGMKLKEMGAINVLVSCAENGAVLIDEFNCVHVSKNADGDVKNTVGCGDSMTAGFITGYELKKDYDYALKLGTACGNATAFSSGLAEKKDIERIFNILKG